MKAWQGRFNDVQSKIVEEFTHSLALDKRLAAYDIRQSIVHARMLAHVGILSNAEGEQLVEGLARVGQDIVERRAAFLPSDEDIHMAIERLLTERIGELGRKLHAGRSRNDQVATDFRLWMRDAIDAASAQLLALKHGFLELAQREAKTVVPAYTHMQQAQPVLFAHYVLGHVEKHARSYARLQEVLARVNLSPLGSGAIAGSSLPLDRDFVARELGFDGVLANSIDATASRDFVTEFLGALALIAVDLSVLAEEWIVWSMNEIGFIKFPDGLCTGSSMMPHKKNPDLLELMRGRAARIIAAPQTFMMLARAVAFGYARDLQEDKVIVFEIYDELMACLKMASTLVTEVRLDHEILSAKLSKNFMNATTLMESLVKVGEPLRTAHHQTGRLVAEAEKHGQYLSDLCHDQIESVAPRFAQAGRKIADTRQSVEEFVTLGSTAPELVAIQIKTWLGKLGSQPVKIPTIARLQ